MFPSIFLHLVAAQIPSEYAENITIYHVNADTYGVASINMDIANLQGDAFFDLRSVGECDSKNTTIV